VFSPVQPFRSSNPQPNQKLEVGQGLEREEKDRRNPNFNLIVEMSANNVTDAFL
jgi:hypothetical protein